MGRILAMPVPLDYDRASRIVAPTSHEWIARRVAFIGTIGDAMSDFELGLKVLMKEQMVALINGSTFCLDSYALTRAIVCWVKN